MKFEANLWLGHKLIAINFVAHKKRNVRVMAIMITDECINCGACEPECPNTAIYEGGVEWKWADGTDLKEIEMEDGSAVDAKEIQEPVSDEFYYIVPGKCT